MTITPRQIETFTTIMTIMHNYDNHAITFTTIMTIMHNYDIYAITQITQITSIFPRAVSTQHASIFGNFCSLPGPNFGQRPHIWTDLEEVNRVFGPYFRNFPLLGHNFA